LADILEILSAIVTEIIYRNLIHTFAH